MGGGGGRRWWFIGWMRSGVGDALGKMRWGNGVVESRLGRKRFSAFVSFVLCWMVFLSL